MNTTKRLRANTTKQLWSLLSRHERKMAAGLLGLMLIGVVLETLGVALVVPALALMTQNDLPSKYPAVAPLLHRLGDPTRAQLVTAGMLVLVGVYAIKSVFLGFLAWRQGKFVFRLQADFSRRLFEGYLRQPYVFHLQRNSAFLIRNTIGQVADIGNLLQQSLILLSELLVLVCIGSLLLVAEPIGAVFVISGLALASWGFNQLTRHRILRWGEARQHHEGQRIQHIQQGLGGAKDVKLLGREGDFLAQYEAHNSASARIAQLQFTLAALPRLWLELLLVSGLAGLIVVMIAQGKEIGVLIPTIGLFAASAFRFMPSITRVLAAFQGIRFSLPVLDTIHSEFEIINATENATHGEIKHLRSELRLENLTFRYPGSDKDVVKDVSLSIPRGMSAGFIGGSGAGKSTLVDLILGLLAPQRGLVKIDGIDIATSMREWQDQIGYVPQTIFLTDDTLRRNVAFGLDSSAIDDAAVDRAIRMAQLDDFVRGLPEGLETVVGERGVRLSGGQRQRIGIARALYHDPQVMVFDEATSSLDIATERDVMDALRPLHGEKTLIIVAHRLSTVEDCDRLFRLENGRLVEEGQTGEVVKNWLATMDQQAVAG